MAKLLIAERDENERIGINWLVSSYSLPFEEVFLTDTFDKTIQLIENNVPDIVCMELDMIPKEKWGIFKSTVKNYVKQTVLITAEATFDRAMQAIEIQAVDLWVKPTSPNEIKKTLQHCLSAEIQTVPPFQHRERVSVSKLSYHSLFLENETKGIDFQLMVLQTENRNQLKELRGFLTEFKFRNQPVLFPLSDLIVTVFEKGSDLQKEGYRILKSWEEVYNEPLAIVIHEGDNDEEQTIHTKYTQAKQALELTFFKGYRQIILFKKDLHWVPFDPFLTPVEQREWIEMLNQADKRGIKAWMYKQFLHLEEPYPQPGLLRTRLTSILAQIRRYMQTYYLNEKRFEASYHQVFSTILNNPVLYRIVQELLLFTYDILDGVKLQKEQSRLDVVEQALSYMELNYYDSTLSLQTVAEYIERSPTYFSHLLAKKLNVSFRQQLTSIRIREAKRLLLETTLSIQEIAEQTGFSQANYFSRIFKEQTGVTPRKYRLNEKYEQNNEHE
ncbi:helix-turn-helix domain-containing protein [Alkalihalobacillus sp. BA299]|uniref:helix-turn-helix domain-containing protein n=1 Tax=Alkalihalobacillus sp. BA299 TaxID=2815938 RepID=UPI001ADC0A3A|nr:helix-turn-helix domain-containing protein [Alkalihalobacillus sp. BA299]